MSYSNLIMYLIMTKIRRKQLIINNYLQKPVSINTMLAGNPY